MNNQSPINIIEAWANAINAGTFEEVINMYAPNAVLLPTFSEQVFTDSNGIRSYFDEVSKNEQVSVHYLHDSIHTDDIGSDYHLLSGLYSWNISNDGATKKVLARFSFLIGTGEAPILHQHSSVVPG